MVSGSDSCSVKKEDVISLDKNDASLVKWIHSVRLEHRISARTWDRLKLDSMRRDLLDRRLQWFGHLERMEENGWLSKHRTFKISGSLPQNMTSENI